MLKDLQDCRNGGGDWILFSAWDITIIIWCALVAASSLDGRLNALRILLDQDLPLRDEPMRGGRLLRRQVTELGQGHGRPHAKRAGASCGQGIIAPIRKDSGGVQAAITQRLVAHQLQVVAVVREVEMRVSTTRKHIRLRTLPNKSDSLKSFTNA